MVEKGFSRGVIAIYAAWVACMGMGWIFSTTPVQAQQRFSAQPLKKANLCDEGVQRLKSSLDVLQAKGGIWGYMEKAHGLKEKSVKGLQVDSKLRRLTVMLERKCKDGDTPSQSIFKTLQSLIGDARMIYNTPPGRAKADQILKTVDSLSSQLDSKIQELQP